ncbi:hypothetical protein BH10PSE19_BH10PSE19_03930 [soil metagenome]
MSNPNIASDPTVNVNPNSVTKAREAEAVTMQYAKILLEKKIAEESLIQRKEAQTVDTRDVVDPRFSTTPLAPLADVAPVDSFAEKRAKVEVLLQALKVAEAQFVDDIKAVFAKFDDKYADGRARLVDDLDKRINQWLVARPTDVNTDEVLKVKALLGSAKLAAPARLDLSHITDLDACFRACTNHVTRVVADVRTQATTVSSLVDMGVVSQERATQYATESGEHLEDIRQQLKSLTNVYNTKYAQIATQIAALQANMPLEQHTNLTTVSAPISSAFLRACDSLRIEPSAWGGRSMSNPSATDATPTAFHRSPTASFPRSRVMDPAEIARLLAASTRPCVSEPSAPPSPFEINRSPVSR